MWDGNNYFTIKCGCYPQSKTATFASPVSIVSLGNLGFYWNNIELISQLSRISPYSIEIYGAKNLDVNFP